ncbi:MAG: nucleotide exchange factor GrpE [Planctomycetales bacterium]|nr:nucleotide exchange factor GrpE [Planctomycetales bacterium]
MAAERKPGPARAPDAKPASPAPPVPAGPPPAPSAPPPPAPASPPPAEVDELRKKARERDEFLSLAQTVQAEYLNYKKRVGREKEEARFAALRDLANALLPLLDDLERAIGAAKTTAADATVLSGLEMVRGQFEKALAAQGVAPFSSLGVPFDPERHEVMGFESVAGRPPGTVVRELRRGYACEGRVIRPARVQVSRAPEPPPAPAPPAAAGGTAP